jgi:hypothetical protein
MNLSEIEPLQVRLSSRSSDKIMLEGKSQEMSVLRRAIKSQFVPCNMESASSHVR